MAIFKTSGLKYLHRHTVLSGKKAWTKSQAKRKSSENCLSLKCSSEILFSKFHLLPTSASKKLNWYMWFLSTTRWGCTLLPKKKNNTAEEMKAPIQWCHLRRFWSYRERCVRSGYPAYNSLPSVHPRKVLRAVCTVRWRGEHDNIL